MQFFVGLHQPSDAHHFERSFISVNRLRKRRSDFEVNDWIMDSGAFSEISIHGRYRFGIEEYAGHVNRWKDVGNMLAAVSQDYMCEPWIIKRTGLSIEIHQRLTIERYTALLAVTQAYLMPVIQGFTIADYLEHMRLYGSLLAQGAWVGVGSICKRNSDPWQILDILTAIKRERPDLRLHGFGLKTTALAVQSICNLLHTADSMAWSFAARKQGRDGNSWREAEAFRATISRKRVQLKPRQSELWTPSSKPSPTKSGAIAWKKPTSSASKACAPSQATHSPDQPLLFDMSPRI